jgi:hypothetical protein
MNSIYSTEPAVGPAEPRIYPEHFVTTGSPDAIGRISFEANGEVDFEVLDRADGASLLFQHESVETLDSRQLDEAYAAFIAVMTSNRGQ